MRDGDLDAAAVQPVPEGPHAPFDADVDLVMATAPSPTATDVLTAGLVDKLDAAARRALDESAGAPGAVVGVRTAQGTWTAAHGLADPDAGVPMATDVHVRIGSVTKTFTGTLLLQLVQEGRLALDDPVDAYIPGVPNGARITLGLLASMRSGVPSYTANAELMGRIVADPSTAFTTAELIAAGIATSPSFDPDARFDYSNTNFALLGQVIEQVGGTAIGELIERRILEPLALSNTSWPGDSAAIPTPHAEGFTLAVPSASGEPTNTTTWNPSWGGAAGVMISTVDDLLIFGRAVVTGQGLLDHATQALRLRSFRPAPAFGDTVEYGLALMSIGGWVGHSGDIPGYRSSMYHEPASDTTVVILVNSDIAAGRCPDAAPNTIHSDVECNTANGRIFEALTAALGLPTAMPHPG